MICPLLDKWENSVRMMALVCQSVVRPRTHSARRFCRVPLYMCGSVFQSISVCWLCVLSPLWNAEGNRPSQIKGRLFICSKCAGISGHIHRCSVCLGEYYNIVFLWPKASTSFVLLIFLCLLSWAEYSRIAVQVNWFPVMMSEIIIEHNLCEMFALATKINV